MKRAILFCVTLVFLMFVGVTQPQAGDITINYEDLTLGNWFSSHLGEVWDLTKCDLTLTYSLDMSNIADAGWAVTEVGLRQVGGYDIDPHLIGGWMQSNYISASINEDNQDLNDMHFLSLHGWMYQEYDATDPDTLITPYWSGANYGFWFDRSGVDQWQAELWGAVDGGTYNTVGVYEIVITYHAIDSNTATMFATINGVQQGLYEVGWKDDQPEFYPAGRSFQGNMTQMQVFFGRGGGGGTVTLSNLEVEGCLKTIVIDGCDTEVPDQEYNGKLISDWIGDCAIHAKNHGEFVSCVAELTNELKKDGVITGKEKGPIHSCAAQADIPHRWRYRWPSE
jgi:hypothetical protein